MLNTYNITTVDGDVYNITVASDIVYKVTTTAIEAPTVIKTPATQGLRGPASTLEIGTITTLEPWEQAYVHNVGTDVHAILNIGIPQGVAGDTGLEHLGDIPDVHLQGILDGQTIVWDGINNIWIPGSGGKVVYVNSWETGMGYTQEQVNALPAFNLNDDFTLAVQQGFRGFAYVLEELDYNTVKYHTGREIPSTQLLNQPYIAGLYNESKVIFLTSDGLAGTNVGFILYPTSEIDNTLYTRDQTHILDSSLCDVIAVCQNWIYMSMDSMYIRASQKAHYEFEFYFEDDGTNGRQNIGWTGSGKQALNLRSNSEGYDGSWGNDASPDQHGVFRRYTLSSSEYDYLVNIPTTVADLLDAGIYKYTLLDLDIPGFVLNNKSYTEQQINRTVFIPNTVNQMYVQIQTTEYEAGNASGLILGQTLPTRIGLMNTTGQPIIVWQTINIGSFPAIHKYTPKGKENTYNYLTLTAFYDDVPNIFSYLGSNPSEWINAIIQENSSQYYFNAIPSDDICVFTFYKDKIYVDNQEYMSWINGKLDTAQINGVNTSTGSLVKYLSEKGSFESLPTSLPASSITYSPTSPETSSNVETALTIRPYLDSNNILQLPAGIKFPNTQVTSSDPNTLDDYEEGTWTPIFTCTTVGNLSVSYALQLGTYIKIGGLVTVNFALSCTPTFTTAASNILISGLPFTSETLAGERAIGGCGFTGWTRAGYTQINTQVTSNSNNVGIISTGSGVNLSTLQIVHIVSGASLSIYGSIVYKI